MNSDPSQKKKIILDFIKKLDLMVISTATLDGVPEAAVVEFGETSSLEIIFDTLKSSRKYKNLKQNNKVAIVIGWNENITVQYEGEAHELFGDELEEVKKLYFAKNARAKRWGNVPDLTYFKVNPKWIRYSDLNTDPWKVFEVTF